jgi:hypothetical protein
MEESLRNVHGAIESLSVFIAEPEPDKRRRVVEIAL